CDAQSLQLMHYLVRSESTGELLIVVTARREDIGGDHPLRRLLGALEAIDGAAEIALARLDQTETEELASSMAGQRLDPAALQRISAESEGNPLFVVEAMRSLGPDGAAPERLSPRLQ